MPKTPRAQWIDLLGRPSTWSLWGLVVGTVVATIVFAFGNLSFVATQPVLSLAANTLLTIGVVAPLGLLSRLLEGRLSARAAGIALLASLLALSALRGLGLDVIADLIGVDDDLSAGFRAIVSISVFAPGLILSVLIVELIRQWRWNQAEILDLSRRREETAESAKTAIDAYLSDVSDWLRRELGHRLQSIPDMDAARARQVLIDTIASIVKPLSDSLQNPAGGLIDSPEPRSIRVGVGSFINRTLTGAPLAPALTGLIFGLTLLPRNLNSGPVAEGLVATVAPGVLIGVGAFAINALSQRILRRLPGWLHVVVLGALLALLGSLLAGLTQLLTGSTLGFDNVFVVGAAATVTLAVLLGGVVNAAKYLSVQSGAIRELRVEVEGELEAARRLQWQRQRALGTTIHGPLQAALNSGSIRLARASSAAEVHDITTWIAREVTAVLDQIPQAETGGNSIPLVIERITDTWEGICEIDWRVADSLLAAESRGSITSAVADVLVEAVFNAIKHQSPARVVVELVDEPAGVIRLRVSHRGSLPEDRRPGLGTQAFEALTSSYSWREKNGGVVFEATFRR